MDKDNFILLCKTAVRPHLKDANSIWCPLRHFKALEKPQQSYLYL